MKRKQRIALTEEQKVAVRANDRQQKRQGSDKANQRRRDQYAKVTNRE